MYRFRYYPDSGFDVITVLLDGLEEVMGRDTLMDHPPLYDYVDPDALNQLFSHTQQMSNLQSTFSFNFVDPRIVLHSNGIIVIYSD